MAQPVSTRQPAHEIRSTCAAYNRALAQRDAAAVAMWWTPDLALSVGNRTGQGSAENKHRFEALLLRRPDLVLRYACNEVHPSDDGTSALVDGEWQEEWTDAGSRVALRGRYAAAWTRTDAGWRIASLIMVPLSCAGESYCR